MKYVNATVDLDSSDVPSKKKKLSIVLVIAVSFKIIMMTSITRPCFTTPDLKAKNDFFGLRWVLS